MKKIKALLGVLFLSTQLAHADSLLKTEKLAEGVFALIGPTGARLYSSSELREHIALAKHGCIRMK